jgi:protein-tyrosine-phosphatase
MVLSRGILFVCTGNSCLSVMAEYLGRERLRGILGLQAQIASAGIRPQQQADSQNAVNTLGNIFGIDATTHVPKDLRTMNMNMFEIIVSIDDKGSDRIAQTVRLLGVLPETMSDGRSTTPGMVTQAHMSKAALEICRALARLRDNVQQRSAIGFET